MMQTDILTANLTASGVVSNQRNRIRGLICTPSATAGSVVLSDGNGGLVKISVSTITNGSTFDVEIPGEGVLCLNGIYATLTNITSVTVFYS